MSALRERAPAKINLTLHVTGQRADGYHLLDSLVVFADIGDELCFAPADEITIAVDGPMKAGVPTGPANLIYQAARMMDADLGAAIGLTKNLPAAAGIGGGSADAAATLRGLHRMWGRAIPNDTARLGADVPVCLSAAPKRMRGVGEVLDPVPDLPDTWVVLINPRVEVPTPSVFKALPCKDNPPMPDEIPAFESARDLAAWIKTQRNDLAAPAIQAAPVIRDVLDALADHALVAQMSGSGATCFGLFDDPEAAQIATDRIKKQAPAWWVACSKLL